MISEQATRENRLVAGLHVIPDSGGEGLGWEFVHVAIDDNSRIAFAKIMEVFGSLAAFAAKREGWLDDFDYGDLFSGQTMLLTDQAPI